MEVVEWASEADIEITGITSDSRKVKPGSVFAAIKGSEFDGHDFIPQVVKSGCSLIVAEREPSVKVEVPLIKVASSRKAWGQMCANFFGNPSQKLQLIGVTGTNGKTTIVSLLADLFENIGRQSGLISTIGNRMGEEFLKGTHTTPDAYELNELLNKMVMSGCSYAFMEVSSHALDQERVAGLEFAGGIFTNITHDHLDYHGDFKSYIQAKKKFFDGLSEDSFALVNADDKNASIMLQNCAAEKFTYGLKRQADFKARIIENSIEGMQLAIDRFEAHFLLSGDYNASNITAAYACGRIMGYSSVELLTAMSRLKAPEGRFEKVHHRPDLPSVIVDYAHTPDALKNILETVAKMKRKGQQLITVFGCGGDRDPSKRPEMGRIAGRWSDQVVITSDNPRTEDPMAIIEDAARGVREEDLHKVRRVASRAEAIKTACKLARSEDIVLVAGKGHEKYQEINGEKFPFDDKEIVRKALGLSD